MANTKASLETAFKYVQEKKLKDLKPNSAIVQEMAGPIKDADKLGRKFLAPVCLSYELGFTFGDGTAFSYNDDVAGVYDEAEIDPNPVVLKSRLSIEAADRMANSEKAVISHVTLRAGQMKSSLMKMAEIEILHGRSGLGVISGNPVVDTAPTPDQAAVILTAASFAPGIWAGMEGAVLEVRRSATKVNAEGDLTLVAVNFDTRTLTIGGTNQDLTDLADADVLFFKGAYANGQYGIKYQLDTSGSVFGIDNSVYAMWKAQEHNVAGQLTMAEVLKGVAKAVARGGLDSDAHLLVSTKTYENLNADLSALSVRDAKYEASKGENGYSAIKYHAQNGVIEIVAHPMMKEGEAFLLPKGSFKKIGATDITFARADGSEGAWEALEGSHAYQLTGRFSFQLFIAEPAKCVLFYGIVNT